MTLKALLKKKNLRILVFGGRDYNDRDRIHRILSRFGDDTILIHGGARGADSLAGRYGEARDWAVFRFPAQWKRFGNSAGPIRNTRMLKVGKPHFAIGFPGGSGTRDMYAKCVTLGVKVKKVGW